MNKGKKLIGMFIMLLTFCISAVPVSAGWIESANGWWYEKGEDSYVTGWMLDEGTWYYFDAAGWMKTGWLNDRGTWYYLHPNGAMATGWLNDGGTWYYLHLNGAMATGWLNDGGTWYYLDGSGAMQTNAWIGSYYVDHTGVWKPNYQAGKWIQSGSRWWYQNADGSYPCAAWKKIQDTWYYFDAAGWMVIGWLNDGGTWYYLQESGAMAANTWIGNYYLGASGAMAVSQWIGPYYVGNDGAWIPGYTGIVSVNKKEIEIPGVKGEYEFAVVNDLHIIVPDGSYLSSKNQIVNARYHEFRNQYGVTSTENWPNMVKQINSYHPDGVVLNGDMIDFYSDANLESLLKGIKNLNAPIIYTRADHDLGIYYSGSVSQEECRKKQEAGWKMQAVMIQEFEEIIIVGINNNTRQISETTLQTLKEIWEKDKPVILFLHVPLESLVNDELAGMSKIYWQNRVLLWGENSLYIPNKTTKQFLDMVYDPNSPVVAVVGAHLHFPHDGPLKRNIRQIVFDAGYKGNIGFITVHGEN
ncbi:MAG: metallophosphoesterase [Lachnospiraceae bacterium]